MDYYFDFCALMQNYKFGNDSGSSKMYYDDYVEQTSSLEERFGSKFKPVDEQVFNNCVIGLDDSLDDFMDHILYELVGDYYSDDSIAGVVLGCAGDKKRIRYINNYDSETVYSID